MHKIISLFCLLCFFELTNAQTIDFDSKNEINQLLRSKNNLGETPFLALTNDCFSETSLQQLGIKINSKIGNVVTFRLNQNQMQAAQTYDGFDYLQIARKIDPKLSRAIPDLRADSVYIGTNLKNGYTGKDVIIGITDWGFDYTHPMFYDTAMQHTRILAAWDQFKKSGPSPSGYAYGTEYVGETALLAAQSDTFNIYENATHGSHVAGIAGGGGAGTMHRGIAFEANYLLATFLVDEAAVIDAFLWMKQKADAYKKRLVINMSWGLYHFGTLDGTSLLSRAIDSLSAQGVVFVTSGGNNGDVDFHIKKDFQQDTIYSLIEFYDYNANSKMWGQSITAWGTPSNNFEIGFDVYDNSKQLVYTGNWYQSNVLKNYLDSFVLIGNDTIFFNLNMAATHPLNQRPFARLRIKNKNTSFRIGLKSTANAGIVHFWNVTELTTDVGNWGMPFSSYFTNWTVGDNLYGIGEPACTKSLITVAAHSSEIRLSNGNITGGALANFSSIGPTLDDRIKPDIAAPGVSVASSISSFTSNSYTLLLNVPFNGKNYPFARFSGTSMSSPATTGVVALMLSANPKLTAQQIKDILIQTARIDKNTDTLPATGNTSWGHGKVNAIAALRMAENLILEDPKPFEHITVYPNPSAQKIAIAGSTDSLFHIAIVSIIGQTIQEYVIKNGETIDLSAYQNGTYLIQFIGTDAKTIKLHLMK